jgi:phage gp29-like protein
MPGLLDQFGREIKIEKKPEMREIAVTAVRDRWSQYPSKGLTPTKLAEIFQEADQGDVYRQAELFEEMEEKDAHLYSQLQVRKSSVLSFDYEVQPYSDSPEDKKIADFIDDTIYNLTNFEDALLDLLDAIGKGYSLEEIIWGIDGRFAVIQDLGWIHQKKAIFYEYQNMWQKSFEVPKIMTEAEPIKGETMPPFKLIYHRHKARSGYDTRAGVLRVCGWMYLFKNYSIKDWVAFAEIYGMPLRLGKYEPGAGKGEKDALITAIQSLGTDAAGIISKNTEIEFIETVKAASTQNIYEQLCTFCDKQMSKAILGQTATSEGTPGKLGSEEARENVRQDLVRADSEALSKTVRYQIFRPLVGYNFGWDKQLPWFKIMYEVSEDLDNLSQVYERIWKIGQPISQEHVSERFKIPLPTEGETILPPPAPGGMPFAMKRDLPRLTKIIASDGKEADWIAAYMESLGPSLKKIKEGALKEIEDWLRSQDLPPSEEIFTSKIQAILGDAYQGIDKAAIIDAVSNIFSNFKGAFGGADIRAVNFLGSLDHFYLSKFIQNPDAQTALEGFLKKQYLEGGAGLFGRGDPALIKEMQNLLSQNLTDLEGYQINRIVDTGVQRVRNWAHISQMKDAGIAEIEIVEPTMECQFCAEMNGKIIQVNLAFNRMMDQADLTPDEYQQFLEDNPPSLDAIEDFVDQGILPPYHPHCHGRIIKRISA